MNINEIRRRLRERMVACLSRLVSPDPPPRCDEVFQEGTRALGRTAGGVILHVLGPSVDRIKPNHVVFGVAWHYLEVSVPGECPSVTKL